MPIQLPNLDDRTYADLVQEALGLIPAYAPEWTNHNPSDPGITLVELFAHLTEMLLYRLNRVTDANMLAYVKLLNGPDWQPPDFVTKESMTEEIRKAVLALREPNRAVTGEDFERLALLADPGSVARTRCIPRRNLESGNANAGITDEPGHVSVIVVPFSSAGESNPQPSRELLLKIANDLEPRRLLTTRVQVVGPVYVAVGIKITLVLKPDAVEDQLLFPLAVADSLMQDLDNRTLSDALRTEFNHQSGFSLSAHSTISVKQAGNSWLVTDADTLRAYVIRYETGSGGQPSLNVYEDVGRAQAVRAISDYFHPLRGGQDGRGWPFGRSIYVSELYELLDQLPSVDYVTQSVDANSKKALDELNATDSTRLKYNADGRLVAVALQAHELVDVRVAPDDITLAVPKQTS